MGFENKCEYLGLTDHAKRGLLTSTMQNTDGKVQILCDRLIPELKHVREEDLDYNSMVAWLKRQDIRQLNDGLSKPKALKKIITTVVNKEEAKYIDKALPKRTEQTMIDGKGLIMRPKMLCFNCSNYGHGANDCSAPFCSKCLTMSPNHTWSKCKNREKGSARPKMVKKDLKRGRSDHSEKTKKKLKQVTYEGDEYDCESLRDDVASECDSAFESDKDELFEEEQELTIKKVGRRFKTRPLKVNRKIPSIRKINSNS